MVSLVGPLPISEPLCVSRTLRKRPAFRKLYRFRSRPTSTFNALIQAENGSPPVECEPCTSPTQLPMGPSSPTRNRPPSVAAVETVRMSSHLGLRLRRSLEVWRQGAAAAAGPPVPGGSTRGKPRPRWLSPWWQSAGGEQPPSGGALPSRPPSTPPPGALRRSGSELFEVAGSPLDASLQQGRSGLMEDLRVRAEVQLHQVFAWARRALRAAAGKAPEGGGGRRGSRSTHGRGTSSRRSLAE